MFDSFEDLSETQWNHLITLENRVTNRHLRGGLLDLLHDGFKATKCLPQLSPCHNFHWCRLEDLKDLEFEVILWLVGSVAWCLRFHGRLQPFIPWYLRCYTPVGCQEAAPRQSPAQNLAAKPCGINWVPMGQTWGTSGPTKLLVSGMEMYGNVWECYWIILNHHPFSGISSLLWTYGWNRLTNKVQPKSRWATSTLDLPLKQNRKSLRGPTGALACLWQGMHQGLLDPLQMQAHPRVQRIQLRT